MSPGVTNSGNEKSNFGIKIGTFVTEKGEAEKLNLQIGHPWREMDLTNAISVQNMVADAEQTRNRASGAEF